MPQINLHVTPAFEDDLALLMREIKTRNKSEAIRYAVKMMAVYVRRLAAADARERTPSVALGAPDRPQCAAGVVETGAPGGSE